MSTARPTACIVGIDSVGDKIGYQGRWLHARGWDLDVLSYHADPHSAHQATWGCIVALPSGQVARVRAVLRHLRSLGARLHHVELYPGGWFPLVVALLCRALRIPVIVVERGELLLCLRRAHPWWLRQTIYLAYLLADRVWAKERSMLAFLGRWPWRRRTFLLPNAVPLPDMDPAQLRTVDLLWVNRLLPERHPDWLLQALETLVPACGLTADVVGVMPNPQAEGLREMQDEVRRALSALPGCAVHEYQEPTRFYRRSRFFVLPGDAVFANYALLEAMAHGVVPIVSDVPGAEQIVVHDVNGLLARHDPAGLLAALERALALPEAERERMSVAARDRIRTHFGMDAWGAGLLREYDRLRDS